MNGLLHVSSSPHARSKVTTDKIMFAVLLALAPAACVGVWNFGLRALLLIAISMAVCPLTEYLYEKGMKDVKRRIRIRKLIRRCVVLAAIVGVVLVEYDRNDKRWEKLDRILKMFADAEDSETEEA